MVSRYTFPETLVYGTPQEQGWIDDSMQPYASHVGRLAGVIADDEDTD
jgi:hypothetical protein